MRILVLFVCLLSWVALSREPLSGKRLQLLTGAKSAKEGRVHWDAVYNTKEFVYGKTPSEFLAQNFKYIPFGAKVLDVGMGEGRHAVYLAQKGYDVTGVDISSLAVKKAYHLAREQGTNIKGVVSSMESFEAPAASFDAIICFYYVDRKLVPKLMKLLKPGGVIIYEAYTLAEKVKNRDMRADPDSYFLKSGELIDMFPNVKILKYEEPLHEKNYRASVIVKKKI